MTLAALLLVITTATPAVQQSIDRFNHALESATRNMDNAATLALWDDDGVSLLPSTPPIAGKPALGKFLDEVTAKFPGAHMESFEMECHTIDASGDSASEWCSEHQVVRFADGKPTFDGRGTMLLVLHRNRGGEWRIKAEMWNPAPR